MLYPAELRARFFTLPNSAIKRPEFQVLVAWKRDTRAVREWPTESIFLALVVFSSHAMSPGFRLSFSGACCFLQLGIWDDNSVHRRDRGHIQLERLDLLHQVGHENRRANA